MKGSLKQTAFLLILSMVFTLLPIGGTGFVHAVPSNSVAITSVNTNGSDDLTISLTDGIISSGAVSINAKRTINVLFDSMILPTNAEVLYYRGDQSANVTDAASHTSNSASAIQQNSYAGTLMSAEDFISVLAEDGTTWRKYSIQLSSIAETVLNNGKLRFGSGSEESIYSTGSLKQPWYYQGDTFYKLTFSSHPLNYAIGVGGTSQDSWNTDGTVTVDDSLSALANLDIDYSKLSGGYGTVTATRTVMIAGSTLALTNKYQLGQDSSFIKITTSVKNLSSNAVQNIRFWVGTRDDFIATSDQPKKVKGNLSDGGEFVPIDAYSTRASALKIYLDQHAVLFFSTDPTTEMLVGNYDGSFTSLLTMNPRDAYSADAGYDGKYGMYVNLGSIGAGQSDSFDWYYAAGSASEIGSITQSIANAAGVSSFDSVTSTSAVLKYSANVTGQAFTLILPATDPAPDQAAVLASGSATTISVANTNYLITFSGLTDNTAYKVYSVLQDTANNVTAVASNAVTTLDGTPPQFVSNYPTASSITTKSAVVKVKSNEAGTFYTLLKLAADAAPDQSAVVSSGIATALASANTEYTKTYQGLSENTEYTVYYVLKDSAGNLTSVSYFSFRTLDSTAPVFSAGYPTISAITANGGICGIKSNEPGTVYLLIQQSTVTSPGQLDVVASGVSVALTLSETESQYTFQGLAASADYIVYMVLSDASGNLSAVTEAAFRTAAQSRSSSRTEPNQQTVLIGGQNLNIGTRNTETVDGVITTVINLNQTNVNNILTQLEPNSTLTIPIANSSNTEASQLSMDLGIVDQIFHKDVNLTVNNGQVSYTLPPASIDIANLVAQFGNNVPESQIDFDITIAEVSDPMVKVVQATALKDEFAVIVPPVEFSVTATYNGQTVNVTQFSSHVSREIALPAGIDPAKITTAIVIKEDGNTYHVPTNVYQKDGVWYAKINSLTNSVYALIYREASFSDTAGRWFEKPVAEAAGRTILNGYADGTFRGTDPITRAEFATMIVNTIGLDRVGSSRFTDITDSNWYYGAVSRASEYKVVDGRVDGTFDPNANITRQEAMIMLQRAGMICGLVPGEVNAAVVLSYDYADQASISTWAREAVEYNLKFGLMKGSNGELKPRANITRAEAATAILRLLQKTDLIDTRTTL